MIQYILFLENLIRAKAKMKLAECGESDLETCCTEEEKEKSRKRRRKVLPESDSICSADIIEATEPQICMFL